MKAIFIYVTFPDENNARDIINSLLEQNLIVTLQKLILNCLRQNQMRLKRNLG